MYNTDMTEEQRRIQEAQFRECQDRVIETDRR
jgi:hypothetical protein